MTKLKEKLRALSNVLNGCVQFIRSEEVLKASKICSNSFSRKRLISLEDLLLSLIFRHESTLNKEISFFFQGRDAPSKQALIKRESQLNYDVWPLLNTHFFQSLYNSGLLERTYKGYLVIAIDGSTASLPFHPALSQIFGGALNPTIRSIEELRMPLSKLSAIYDPLNKIILDFAIKPYNSSEIPIMFEQLDKLFSFLKGKKVIFLADRYYGSADFFLWCEKNGFSYIVRAKSNFYKDQRALIDEKEDAFLEINIHNAWKKRLKREDVKEWIEEDYLMKIRRIKADYEYIETQRVQKRDKTWVEKETPKSTHCEYFTNLKPDIFNKEDILYLYHTLRWDIETAYDILKNDIEIENVHSTSVIAVINMIYAKVFFFNLEMSLNVLAQDELGEEYVVNNVKIISLCRTFSFIKKLKKGKMSPKRIKRIIKEALRYKTKVKKKRHVKRWGRFFKAIPQKKFRIDGRSNPKVKKCSGGYSTSHYA